MDKTKVFYVDDKKINQDGLKLYAMNLNFELKTFSTTKSYELALGKCTPNILPDIVILDMEMGGELKAGIRLAKFTSDLYKNIKIIVLSAHDNNIGFINEALNNGANGYISTNDYGEEDIEAILLSIHKSDLYVFNRPVVKTLLSSVAPAPLERNESLAAELEPYKGIEIIKLLAEGCPQTTRTNEPTIYDRLYTTPPREPIKNRIRKIAQILGCPPKGVVVKALKEGLISIHDLK